MTLGGTLLSFLLLSTTVTLQRSGVPVEGGEVCRFAAADRENPFQRWLASQQLICVPAGSAIEFPSGLWNVFGRAAGVLSIESQTIDGDAAPQMMSLRLSPAATVVVALPAEHRGVVYAPRRASAFPVGQETNRVPVPAGEELWLFLLETSRITGLVPIAALEAGTERVVDARSGPSSIIGWIQVRESDRAALRGARNVESPRVRATTSGPALDSDPLAPLELLHGSFVRLRGVAAGEADVDIGGRGWVPHRRRVKVSSAITTAADPLIARPAATLIVNWSTSQDLPALDRSIGSCEKSEKTPRVQISIASCAPPQRPNEPPDPTSCSVFREESFEPGMTYGAVTAEDLVPGFYRAEMRFGKLPPIAGSAQALPLQQRSIRFFTYYIQAYGSVTRGGEPVGEDTTLEFPGNGVGFAPGETSEYQAVLPGLIGSDAQITVAACDGTPRAVVFTDRPIRRSARFDIDIPANEVTITVSDTFTREPLRGATVRYVVMSAALPRRPLLTRSLTAGGEDDSDARLVITAVPEREIRLSVSHAGYQKQDIDPFSMTKSEKKTLDVQLVPLRGSRGKIMSSRPFDSGAVYWYAPSGAETERAELASDGTFVYANAHDPGETMAVVSASHPLWVLRAPSIERRQTIQVVFPDAPVRAFDVSIRDADRRDNRHIGIVIGGVRVPQPPLRQHQFLRNFPPTLRGAGPLRFADIAETGPIELLLGPNVEEVSTRASGMDLFALPQFSAVPRVPLPSGATGIELSLP